MKLIGSRTSRLISIFLIFTISLNLFFLITTKDALAQSEPGQPEAVLNPITDSDYVTYQPGSTARYDLILRNIGNQWESFYLDVESDNDWGIEIDPQTGIGLSPGETMEIQVSIDIPVTFLDDYYKFDIIVKSRSIPAGETAIHVIITADGIIITARIKPILITVPVKEQLGIVGSGEKLEVDVEVKCFVVSAEVYIEYDLYKIMDAKFLPEKNLTITIDPERKRISKRESQRFTITIELSEEFDESVNYSCTLFLHTKASGYDVTSKPIILSFLVHSEPKKDSQNYILANPAAIIGISTILIIGAIGAAIGSSEVGKYGFLTLLFVPLYTKIHKDKILDHFTRGRVYEYVRNNPGVHYSEIKRELDLNNGSLAYHLHTLEREELIKSRTNGRFKLFYPTGVKIPKDMEPQVSSIRRQILNIIRDIPGITQKELALKLPIKTQRTISYHIKNMEREGVLRLEKAGRETKCFIADNVIEIRQTGVVFKEIDDATADDQTQEYSDSILRQI